MPYTFAFMTDDGAAALEKFLKISQSPESLETVLGHALAQLTAEAFRRQTGEVLIVGQTSLALRPIRDNSLPVPLFILVVVNWTEARRRRFELIRRQIERTVRTWNPGLVRAQAKLSPIAAPRPGRTDQGLGLICNKINGNLQLWTKGRDPAEVPIEVPIRGITGYSHYKLMKKLGIVESVRRSDGSLVSGRYRLNWRSLTPGELRDLINQHP